MKVATLLIPAAFALLSAMPPAVVAEAPAATDFASVTNFTTCSQSIRNEFKTEFNKAFAAGDFAKVKSMLDALARDKDVTVQVYDLWDSAQRAFINDAVALAKKKPAEQAELIAGFRDEGSTFGLWQVPLEINGRPALDKARLDEARRIMTELMPQDRLSPAMKIRRDKTLLWMQSKAGTEKGRNEACEKLVADAVSLAPVSSDDTNMVYSAVNESLDYFRSNSNLRRHLEVARLFGEKLKGVYGPAIVAMKGRELASCVRLNDEASIAKLRAEIDALPLDASALGAYFAFEETMTRGNPFANWGEIAALMKRATDARAKFPPAEHARLTLTLHSAAKAADDIAGVVKYYDELAAIKKSSTEAWNAEEERVKAARAEKREYTRNPAVAKPDASVDRVRQPHIAFLVGKRAYREVLPAIREAVAFNPPGVSYRYDLARALYCLGDNTGALSEIAILKTNGLVRADARFNAAVLEAAISARDARDFKARLLTLRALSDAEAAAGETKLVSDTRFFNRLRAASRALYEINSDQEHYKFIEAIYEVTGDMLYPEEKLVYATQFVKSAPHTAEGALFAGIFDKYPTENRMGKYSVYSHMEKTRQVALLKSGEPPHLQADVPGKEGCVVVLYDTTGLHFYVKLNDPAAAKTRDGYADGARMEFSIMPGDCTERHWNLVSARYPRKYYDVDWDSPMPGRKLTCDYLEVDSVSTDDCHVFHIFTPWIMFYDRLPEDGSQWWFVLCPKWADLPTGALGGGSVHETGRGMRVKFAMPAAARAAVRLGVLRQAVGEYKALREEWSNADFWGDPHMGDAEFYEAEVKPWLAALDKEAAAVIAGEPAKAEVDRLFNERIFEFADFRLAIDAKRAAWLKSKFYKE